MSEFDDIFEQLKVAQEATVTDKAEDKKLTVKKYKESKENISKNVTIYDDSHEKSKLVDQIVLEQPKLSKSKKKVQLEANSGSKWFDMPKGNAKDPQVMKDLVVIQQRAALDPKRHYKKDKWKIPKYFQTGTIIEDKAEFYSARLKNKERKQTMLQEVLYDADSQKYFKKKYSEIQTEKAKVVKYRPKKRR